jgi:hypothetical protein
MITNRFHNSAESEEAHFNQHVLPTKARDVGQTMELTMLGGSLPMTQSFMSTTRNVE